MIVACDVDGTVADLLHVWLGKYNADYDDDLTPEDITGWDVAPFVKPECGKKIYDYLRRGDLYDEVPVISGALEGVEDIRRRGHRVVFVTTCVKNMTDPKWNWLERHGFLPKGRHNQDDLVIAADKTLIDARLLIDDRPTTIERWVERQKRHALLFWSSYNHTALDHKPSAFWLWATKVKTWLEIKRYFDALERKADVAI